MKMDVEFVLEVDFGRLGVCVKYGDPGLFALPGAALDIKRVVGATFPVGGHV